MAFFIAISVSKVQEAMAEACRYMVQRTAEEWDNEMNPVEPLLFPVEPLLFHHHVKH
jgi:hypothetical protein